MNREVIAHYIAETFAGLDTVAVGEDIYWFYDPDGTSDPKRRMPFATLMTSDANDSASNLSRPGVFRLNIGVARETYASMFGPPPKADWSKPTVDTGYDYSALDQIMPHPVYCSMSWICVLTPSDATFEKAKPLLAEAHRLATQRHSKRSVG